MSKIVVVDYGIGNVFSVCNALKAIGAEPSLTRSTDQILNADRLILPGVGAFPKAMEGLRNLGLIELLARYVETDRPLLGICVGMQMLMNCSDEIKVSLGLGYIDGRVKRISNKTKNNEQLRIPHVSWANLVKPLGQEDLKWEGTLLEGLEANEKAVYFVHSFHAVCSDPTNLLAEVKYGGNRITAAVQKDNITGFQFHPERSGKIGQHLLNNFVNS